MLVVVAVIEAIQPQVDVVFVCNTVKLAVVVISVTIEKQLTW